MRRALTYASVFAVLFAAVPIAAQTIVSTHPPLSPAEAVRVLRASQSPNDVTDVPFYGGDAIGPLVLVGGGASVRDWPTEAYEPIRPLAEPWYQIPYLGGWRGVHARSAGPLLTVSPWSMTAYVGGLSRRAVDAVRDRTLSPRPTRRDGTANPAPPRPQRTFPEGRSGAGVIIRR